MLVKSLAKELRTVVYQHYGLDFLNFLKEITCVASRFNDACMVQLDIDDTSTDTVVIYAENMFSIEIVPKKGMKFFFFVNRKEQPDWRLWGEILVPLIEPPEVIKKSILADIEKMLGSIMDRGAWIPGKADAMCDAQPFTSCDDNCDPPEEGEDDADWWKSNKAS